MSYRESITAEEIEMMELAAFDGRVHIITKLDDEYYRAIEHLEMCRMIGFDTETKPVFQPNARRHSTALLQLSSDSDAFLFRLHLMGLPDELASILASPSITKIGAAVNDDIHGLQRYNNFTAARFMDLQRFGDKYGIKDKSVKKMAGIILGVKVSKSQQLSNWEAEELSHAQCLYAATDAWICLKMYKKLLSTT
mgnify:CR=1 FL=1